jgi:hypothetical protein
MDYGVLCFTFLLLGVPLAFQVVYTVVFAATTVFLALAAVRWFRELRGWESSSVRDSA